MRDEAKQIVFPTLNYSKILTRKTNHYRGLSSPKLVALEAQTDIGCTIKMITEQQDNRIIQQDNRDFPITLYFTYFLWIT